MSDNQLLRHAVRWLQRKSRVRMALVLVCLFPLVVLLVLASKHSLTWPMHHDLPVMLYLAFLMDRFDFVPYRDFFDMNMLGTHLAYLGIGRIFGYGPVAVRWADLTVLSSIGALTVLTLRRMGVVVGVFAFVLFGIWYMGRGPSMSLQREYLMLVPLLLGTWGATRFGERPRRRWAVVAGAGFGLAATLKPHCLIALVPVGIYLWTTPLEFYGAGGGAGKERLRSAGLFAAGVASPLLLCVASIIAWGAFDEFWQLVYHYLPLYGSMNGIHERLDGLARLQYVVTQTQKMGRQTFWALGAAVGVGTAMHVIGPDRARRRSIWLIAGLTLAFLVYPALTGQFWMYHWVPLVYWQFCCIALLAVRVPASLPPLERIAAPAVLVIFAFFLVRPDRDLNTYFEPQPPDKNGIPQEIGAYLEAHLRPGETVQTLDWTGIGALHGLLEAEAKVATPFIYDFHFYHHVSTPFIKGLRKRFIAELAAARPRFIVQGKIGPYPRGEDSSREFPELEQLLLRHYRPVVRKKSYAIHEWRGAS